jgi:hypothetical protein
MAKRFGIGTRIIVKDPQDEDMNGFYNYGTIIAEDSANEVIFDDYYTIRLLDGTLKQVYKNFIKRNYKIYDYEEFE